MPLPDERPRQSVANLIGKFETQSKHLSPSQSNPSRSSSVVSQVTSDTKEEIKEKREWPPKSVVEKTAPGPYRVMPSRINPDATNQPAVHTEAEAPATLPLKQQQAHKEPETFLENWRKGLPQPTEMDPEPTTPKPADEHHLLPAPVQKVVSAPQPPRTPTMKASSTKIPASTSSKSVGTSAKATPKSAWKSTPPKQPLTPATSAQPLKPQLTGQSMVSSTSRRNFSSSRAKTPTRTATGTKTPILTPRSKTPSSGLFAPTAASLARARNAPLPPPPSIKKTAISSDAMDRLSRPTAASLSRVKTGPTSPTLVPTPKSPPRISSARSKSTVTPSKSPQTVKKHPAIPQGPSGSIVPSIVAPAVAALVVVEPEPEQPPPQPTANGHPANEVTVADVPIPPEVEEADPDTSTISENIVELKVNDEGAVPSQTSEAREAEPEVYDLANGAEVKEAASTTSLEDIVLLLETAPAARPSTEEISEIPDEDEDD